MEADREILYAYVLALIENIPKWHLIRSIKLHRVFVNLKEIEKCFVTNFHVNLYNRFNAMHYYVKFSTKEMVIKIF